MGGDVAVAGVLDLLGLRYTGGGPGELYLRQDKGLAKKVLAFEQHPLSRTSPSSPRTHFETAGNLRMPLFVKPLTADASIGIDGDSLVRDTTSLMKRVLTIHEKFKDAPWSRSTSRGASSTSASSATASRWPSRRSRWTSPACPKGCRTCRHQGQVGEEQRRVQGDEVGPGRHPRRAAGEAPEGRAGRLPRPARPRLRPGRPPADRDRRHLRHRGQRQLLPGRRRASSRRRRRRRGSSFRSWCSRSWIWRWSGTARSHASSGQSSTRNSLASVTVTQ